MSVYSGAGVKPDRIFSVTGGKRKDCVHIDSYASHLRNLNNGVYDFVQPFDSSLIFHHINSVNLRSRRLAIFMRFCIFACCSYCAPVASVRLSTRLFLATIESS